ncbi:MAG: DUF805 domain-containing protein [Sphingomonas sp.]
MNLKRNLTGLLDFSGRQNREPFWIWVLICYVVRTGVSMIAMIPFFAGMFGNFERIAARGPGAAPIKPEEMFADMQPWMFGMALGGAVAGVVFVGLVAAAVVRRLHDREISGWWALPVLLINVVSQVSSLSMMASGKLNLKADPAHPFANVTQNFGLLSLLTLVTIIAFVVVLALPGTPGANRYGPDPLAAR